MQMQCLDRGASGGLACGHPGAAGEEVAERRATGLAAAFDAVAVGPEERDQVNGIAQVAGVVIGVERRPRVGLAHREARPAAQQLVAQLPETQHAGAEDFPHGVAIGMAGRIRPADCN